MASLADSTVALLRCGDYESVGPAVARLVDLVGATELVRGKSVLLKVNLMKGVPPERALCTHPEFVRAVIRALAPAAGRISVGDSSGTLGQTAAAFERSGIAEVVESEGAELVNLEACEPVPVDLPAEHPLRVYVAKQAVDADALVTLPKLKTHDIMGMTCAVKNQVGLLPGGSKCFLHVGAPDPESLARRIVHLNLRVKPSLAIVDGVWGLEGGGSGSGRRKDFGVVAASRDLVAVDAVCASVMGLPDYAVRTTRIGAELGLGCGSLASIEVVGDSAEQCRAPCTPAKRTVKCRPVIGSIMYRVRGGSLRPVVREDDCKQCRQCAEVCPVDAIDHSPFPAINSRCIFCYACYELCPVRAYDLKPKWYLVPLYARKAEGKLPASSAPRGGE